MKHVTLTGTETIADLDEAIAHLRARQVHSGRAVKEWAEYEADMDLLLELRSFMTLYGVKSDPEVLETEAGS